MTSNDEELAATYGPAAPISEHKRGEAITYRTANGQAIISGTIISVCAAGMVADKYMGLHYIVAPDEPTGFIDVAFPDDVVVASSDQADEPTMKRCPYCHQLHRADQVEQCPLKPC